jgi:hypothetical protein
MKPSIAITLILLGSVLILVPPASEWLRQREGVRLLMLYKDSGMQNAKVDLPPYLGPYYSFGCYAVGAFMIFVAIRRSAYKTSEPGGTSAGG